MLLSPFWFDVQFSIAACQEKEVKQKKQINWSIVYYNRPVNGFVEILL